MKRATSKRARAVTESTKMAMRIARDLFTDGCGGRAGRLVMEYTNECSGCPGWSEVAAAERIEAMIAPLYRVVPKPPKAKGGKGRKTK